MKDVSKQTLEDLITFIYYGEVNVEHGNFDEFQKTAAALKIKGLNGILNHSKSSVGLDFTRATPVVHNGSQYQSTQTIRVHGHPGDGLKGVQKSANNIGDSADCWNELNYEPNHDEMNQNSVFGMETNADYSDDLDQKDYEQQWYDYGKSGYQENDNKTSDSKKMPAAKRAKRTNGKTNKISFFVFPNELS